jgi:hypothetical protein
MGFGSSNERGVVEEEAVDELSDRGTPDTHSVDKRRKPNLKLEEPLPSKKPKCECQSISDGHC